MEQIELAALEQAFKYHGLKLGEQQWPAASLYVVATPIGNLADLSLRAWYALSICDAIAAEDTRTSQALLQAWGIKTPLLAAHRHNEHAVAQRIVQALEQGQRIALVADAGSPAVSDPGGHIVKIVQAQGLRVIPIAGPSALLAALMASGATADDQPAFCFAGFMPAKAQARRTFLQHWLQRCDVPLVLFETPHRIVAATQDLLQLGGGTRQITIAREISKRFEEIQTLPLAAVANWLQADKHRGQGEFVLVLHAKQPNDDPDVGLSVAEQRLMTILLDEMSLRDAARVAAKITGQGRSRFYEWGLQNRG